MSVAFHKFFFFGGWVGEKKHSLRDAALNELTPDKQTLLGITRVGAWVHMRARTHTHKLMCVDAGHVSVYGRGLGLGVIQTSSWVVTSISRNCNHRRWNLGSGEHTNTVARK